MLHGHWLWLSLSSLFLLLLSVTAYEVPVTDEEYDRQICSGMWADQNTYINVTFDSTSRGQVAMVIYEWGDMEYLGKATVTADDLPQKTYVCTSDAVKNGYCENSELGRFIVDLPSGKSINETSFWSARVSLSPSETTSALAPASDVESSGFWDNPEGNPTPPDSEHTTPWRRDSAWLDRRQALNPSPSGILTYSQPIQYKVRKTGYYCVAIVPVTVLQNSARQANTDVPYHPTYKGTVFFRNTFDGKLPATDYPKVNFYFAMFLVYTAVACGWAWLCYRNLQDLLPIQYYLSSLLGFLIIEMVANWAYYRYLNAHGRGTPSTVFLIVVAILDAGRNALSFFLLLVVSLGLSVVRETLGKTMIKCQALAVAHFIFGVLYAVGIVELELESTSALVLLLFVIPLAFTLSAFLLWILYALNATITQLAVRKQNYKLSMFRWLHRILLMTIVVIALFFVVSSLTFSGRLAEDYGAKSWRVQWWLLDGWLALLYLVDFVAIAYLWRPSPNNRRLAMFDELAQDPADAEDYDLEAFERHENGRDADDDAATLVGNRGPGSIAEDAVVFDIGDEDGDDDEPSSAKKRLSNRDREDGEAHEREGLMKDD
ncbi:hypothetical protein WOLCODRAFT_112920 [Wolfiporia cocos MD-104 SS10]|uniref:Integral membrane protein n=1 Tax=Wolfiporia cocos (strain MD-104) TaxID=742152 RepID=A0A2H3IVH3_WOLCO|nr:hypothetical protein WOLCODRAFT_112920 [Wolfiporia cocos MD-104 SS10]